MYNSYKLEKEINKIIARRNLNCSVATFDRKADFYSLSNYQYLSEGFIRKFQDKIDWSIISRYQRLSEKFIKEFEEQVDWYLISKYQILSEEFLHNNRHRIDFYNIEDFSKISKRFILNQADLFSPMNVLNYHCFDDDFVKDYIAEKARLEENKLIAMHIKIVDKKE